MNYLDCGCAITDDGSRSWCPSCSSTSLPREEGIVEEFIRLEREPTQSELVQALQGSLSPVFDYFQEKLVERDGQILDIRITAKAGKLSLEYGVGPIDEPSSDSTNDDLPPSAALREASEL